jgi:hypothetical protein
MVSVRGFMGVVGEILESVFLGVLKEELDFLMECALIALFIRIDSILNLFYPEFVAVLIRLIEAGEQFIDQFGFLSRFQSQCFLNTAFGSAIVNSFLYVKGDIAENITPPSAKLSRPRHEHRPKCLAGRLCRPLISADLRTVPHVALSEATGAEFRANLR